MIPYVRMYESERTAREAINQLVEAGLKEDATLLMAPETEAAATTVRTAVRAGLVPDASASVAAQALRDGRWVVAVRAPFGFGKTALAIMERDAVDIRKLPRERVDAALFSDLFGFPVLTRSRPNPELATGWFFSNELGFLPLLSKKATPFSSLFALPVLSKPKKGPWKWSWGLPLLTNKAAPFSSLFGLKVLTTPQTGEWRSSFGFPLLVKSSAPFSRVFGLPVLTDERRL